MKIVFVLFFLSPIGLLFAQPSEFAAQTPYFQQQVNYKINVTLNDNDNTLDGYLTINYTNNSADTLQYVWFHLWPNAYKSDKTAFSDQFLENGRTDFYFSDNDKRGYINRLDFKVNGLTARIEDHPQHIDIVKLVLPVILEPRMTITIATPFHVKLPYNFSRGGFNGKTFQVTQWYPKPAVYDRKGWHPMPYLDQGEFYSEFGDFDVQITVPENYVVAATGELQNEAEKDWLLERSKKDPTEVRDNKEPGNKKIVVKKVNGKPQSKKPVAKPVKQKPPVVPQPKANSNGSVAMKTLNYIQKNVHDFAWFADKAFRVRTDSIRLQSGRIVNAYAFFTPAGAAYWKNSIGFIQNAINTRSTWLGEYPYNTVTAVEAKMGFEGGMEYPTITSISPVKSERELEFVIQHEVGHNWNYGVLASNEREHPWMDEGMNTFFDFRYEKKYASNTTAADKMKQGFISRRLPAKPADWAIRTLVSLKEDQPIETPSEKFSLLNYNFIAYDKAGKWMQLLEKSIGSQMFDSCLHVYYDRWKFKHPYPEDFKKVIEDVSGRNVDSVFSLLTKRGNIDTPVHRDVKVMPFFSFNATDKFRYLFVTPAVGYNYYDKLMLGGLLHNYTLPAERLQFLISPMYGIQSKKLTGLARVAYNQSSYGLVKHLELSASVFSFSVDNFTDSARNTKYLNATRFVPSVKIVFREKNPASSLIKWMQWKTYFINEENILFTRNNAGQQDIITFPKSSSYINQLKFGIKNTRALYPFDGVLQAEQGDGFIRTALTGNYFFNYTKGDGMHVRFFVGKFIYLGDKTFYKQFATDRYHLNMTGANGYEDYTYSGYFIGRNEFKGLASQQIMIRDGGFKVRTDLLSQKVGKTDDWLASLNFKTGIPANINPLQVLPVKIPVKLFFDVGTYAEAWDKSAATSKFIYDAGFEISLFHDLVNIYMPVLYSKVYSDYFKSTIIKNRFFKNISFSIDIENFSLKRVFPQIPF